MDAAAAQNGNAAQRLVRVFADVFVPIIPVMVATGLFMGLRGFLTQPDLLAMLGLTTDSIPQNFLSFTQILTDTAFSFLPRRSVSCRFWSAGPPSKSSAALRSSALWWA